MIRVMLQLSPNIISGETAVVKLSCETAVFSVYLTLDFELTAHNRALVS